MVGPPLVLKGLWACALEPCHSANFDPRRNVREEEASLNAILVRSDDKRVDETCNWVGGHKW